jgi:hypothetical protein
MSAARSAPYTTTRVNYGFQTTNSINHIVENIIQIGPNFISQQSVENIACVGQKTYKFGQKEVHIGPTQNQKKNMRFNLGFLVLRCFEWAQWMF